MAMRGSGVLAGVAAIVVFGVLAAGLASIFEDASELLWFVLAPIGGLGALYVAAMVYDRLEKAGKSQCQERAESTNEEPS